MPKGRFLILSKPKQIDKFKILFSYRRYNK